MPSGVAANTERRRLLLQTLEPLQRARLTRGTGLDAVVMYNEVNDRHGTGLLVQRLFPNDEEVLSIRAVNSYGAEQTFGAYQLVVPDGCRGREQIYLWTSTVTAGLPLARITCVPFSDVDVMIALALHDLSARPMCLYIMDDNNVYGRGISDALLSELVGKARIRFVISSDMQHVYERKFAAKFWILPPTLSLGVAPVAQAAMETGRAVVIGNIWGSSWLEALQSTVSGAGLRVDWFANSTSAAWHDIDRARLSAAGVEMFEPLPEVELAARLDSYEVALVPSGPHGQRGENPGVAKLSLPTRLAYTMSASDLPMIVLGARGGAAARFVEHFNVGVGCAYEPESLQEALRTIRSESWRKRQRRALPLVRALLRMDDVATWVRQATETGEPPSMQFEELQVLPPLSVRPYVDDTPALGPWFGGFQALHAALRRMRSAAFHPDFILDVGASSGIWSFVAARTFPEARYVLIEPLAERYEAMHGREYLDAISDAVVVAKAVAAAPGAATLHIDAALFQASLVASTLANPEVESAEVEITTLDTVARELHLTGRGLLKLDIQGAELQALDGARALLSDAIDVVMVEVTLDPHITGVPPFRDVDAWLAQAGFAIVDEAGEWRDPRKGTLLQKDIVYSRVGGPLDAPHPASGKKIA